MRHALTALLLSWSFTAGAANPDQPHPHKGVSQRFTAPEHSTLSEPEQKTLSEGQSVRRQVRQDSGGRGISIMDIQATPDRIWTVILDYSHYPDWIDNLDQTLTYKDANNHLFVEFQLSVFGMKVVYYIDHTVDRDQGRLTWQLDYSRESDIDDSTGYWLVYPAPGRPGYTRVEYSVDLRLKGWVPGIIENMLAKKGLDMATSWVKKQAERGG